MVLQALPLAPTDLNVLCLVVGGFIVAYGLVSLLVREKFYVAESTVAVLFGIAVGGSGLGLLHTNEWAEHGRDHFMLEACRVLIAIQVMIAGIELPGRYLRTQLTSVMLLLTALMLVKWLTTALLMWAILGFDYLDALIIAACVAPTDPVLANSIVKGKYAERHVPTNIRDLLSAESGANDGLGYPFLYIALYLKTNATVGGALADWAVNILVYQIIVSIGLGALIGWGAKCALTFCSRRDWIDKPSFLAYGVSLSVFILGLLGYLGTDDLLAAFIAGNSLTWDDWYRLEHESEHIQSTVDTLMTVSFFIYFGATFPFHEIALLFPWWKVLLLSIAVLVLRRMPWLLALYRWIPAIHTPSEALFAGWFGPMGVSALFYAYLVKLDVTVPDNIRTAVVPIVSLLVLASVLCHGTSVAFFKMGKSTAPVLLEFSRTLTSTVAARARRSMSKDRSASPDARQDRRPWSRGRSTTGRGAGLDLVTPEPTFASGHASPASLAAVEKTAELAEMGEGEANALESLIAAPVEPRILPSADSGLVAVIAEQDGHRRVSVGTPGARVSASSQLSGGR
ncbi:hypothetical protein GGF31_002656 [Allomyces arbusculus]|nr:hypothetical protein GGF31_002656 [Allomyces arbusculus]